MSSERVTEWLSEQKPRANVEYQGEDEEGIHVWEVHDPDSEHGLRLGMPARVVEDEGLLAERLMELITQGWLDQLGEKPLWVLVAPGDVAAGPSRWE